MVARGRIIAVQQIDPSPVYTPDRYNVERQTTSVNKYLSVRESNK